MDINEGPLNLEKKIVWTMNDWKYFTHEIEPIT